jgi:hypothetical protein
VKTHVDRFAGIDLLKAARNTATQMKVPAPFYNHSSNKFPRLNQYVYHLVYHNDHVLEPETSKTVDLFERNDGLARKA